MTNDRVSEFAPKPRGNGEQLLSASDHMKEHGEVVAKGLEVTADEAAALGEAVAEECRQTARAVRENVELEAQRCRTFYQRMREIIDDVRGVRASISTIFDPPKAQPGESPPATPAEAAGLAALAAIAETRQQ